MLPTAITKWADTYNVSQPIMWEIVETVTNSGNDLHEIEDESHLFNLTLEWACAMIESVAEDGTQANYQTFILYYLPIVFALAPYLMADQRSRIIRSCYDDKLLVRAVQLMLDRDDDSPNPPASLR